MSAPCLAGLPRRAGADSPCLTVDDSRSRTGGYVGPVTPRRTFEHAVPAQVRQAG